MDRNEKKRKLKEVELLIDEKNIQISELNKELEKLKQERNKIHESSLPILLFVVDSTIPMPDLDEDWRKIYIYYCPDFDEIRSYEEYGVTYGNIAKHFLPNTLDLRECFKKCGMPERAWISYPCIEYKYIVNKQVDNLKIIIENIFSSNHIESWDELRDILLQNYKQEKDKTYVKST